MKAIARIVGVSAETDSQVTVRVDRVAKYRDAGRAKYSGASVACDDIALTGGRTADSTTGALEV